jgi:multicomponent Na+:H+ antiporter subunit D
MAVLLAAAAFISVARKNSLAKQVTLSVLAGCFGISVTMVAATAGGATIDLVIGAPPWNISMYVGAIEAFMSCLFTGIGFLIMWASVTMIDHDVEEKRIPLYYTLICVLISMLCGIVFFDNMFNVFIVIELGSTVAAGIVIIKGAPENIRAGFKYFALSILGSGFILMGIVVFYTLTGSLAYDGIHAGLVNNGVLVAPVDSVFYALLFITIGVGFKSALFPMHIWLPDAHGTAPSPSSAVLSSLVLKAYIIFYIKIVYVVIGANVIYSSEGLSMLLNTVLVLGVIAMLAGSCMAIMQTDIKRMIAYSSVAQIGYIFMGIGLASELGLFAAIYHILAHAVTKAGLFLAAGSIIEQTHNREIGKMGGIGYQMPITIAIFTIGALSMVGLPLFIGFNSKWNFAMAIMDSGQFWLVAALALSSLLNAVYYLPLVIRAFFGAEAREQSENRVSLERPTKHLMPIIALAGLVMVFAVYSGPVISLIEVGMAKIW